LTVLAGAGADFFMIALTVTAIVVVVLRALNVKTFFSETKRVKKKERQGERPKTRGRFKTTPLFYLFFRRLLGVKKIRKNCIERFSSSSSSHFFFHRAKKMHRQKSKKMPKEKRGLSKKKKRKRERRGPQLFDHHRPPPSSFLKKKRRDKNRTAEKKTVTKEKKKKKKKKVFVSQMLKYACKILIQDG